MESGFDRRAMLKALGIGGALALAPGWASAAAAEGRPWTIPALREWRPSGGTFEPGSPTRIVLAPRDADALTPTADVVAADLHALLNRQVNVVVRGGEPRLGEIALWLGDDPVVGDEGYRLRLGDAAVITANTAAGTFYGTRSLLQLLAQSTRVPTGVALDWPRYPQRGLMMDIGRKHFSFEWLAERIPELAYLKLNYLHLHFTEDLGWRIQSDRSPPVHSDRHLTKQQVSALVELAARHHITVIPEIDIPGHMEAALRNYPQFQLRNALGIPKANSLDYTVDEARRFAFALIEEYLPLFPGPHWHTGADEFLSSLEWPLYPHLERYAMQRYGSDAVAQDGVLGLVNDINDLVKRHGKTLRVAHDALNTGNVVTVDKDVVVEWWTDFTPFGVNSDLPTPQELLDAGFQIVNAGWYPTNYSNLGIPLPPKPDLKGMYEIWAVHRFRGPLYVDGTVGAPYHDINPAESRNLGSRLAQWNDDPDEETEEQIAEGIRPRLRIMAQQTWESPPVVPTYAEFEHVIDAVGDHPTQP